MSRQQYVKEGLVFFVHTKVVTSNIICKKIHMHLMLQ